MIVLRRWGRGACCVGKWLRLGLRAYSVKLAYLVDKMELEHSPMKLYFMGDSSSPSDIIWYLKVIIPWLKK